MRNGFPRTRAVTRFCLAGLCLISSLCGLAQAQEWRRERAVRHDMFFDDRHHHGHYYPAAGFAVTALPPGSMTLAFGGGRYYHYAGVWYQPAGPGFVVVRPPVGIVVPVLPTGYSTVWVGSTAYYYANSTYYAAAPNGYAVVAPPAVAMVEAPAAAPALPVAPAPAAPAPAAPVQPQAPALWYYCESAKTYYPYVGECKEGWRTVPATPPR